MLKLIWVGKFAILLQNICEKIGGVKMATCKGLWVHVTPLTKPKFCQLFMNVHILIVDPELTPPELIYWEVGN